MMQHLQLVQYKAVDFWKSNTRALQGIAVLFGLYAVKKVVNSYWYSRKLFSTASEIENKVVLLTGCGTGFGHAAALKLSVVCGFRVIATCRRQQSVDEFLSNSEFTKNGSTAIVMDVTKQQDLQRAKQFTVTYLSETNSVFWALINNAGVIIPGEFEVVPKEMDELERNTLLMAPINVTRLFLPLIHGRKNYQTMQATKTANNGGRIVNVTSLASYWIVPKYSRYGVCKAALSYFSHTLRMELSPRFGIWVNEVAPGPFATAIVGNSAKWAKKVEDKLAEKGQSELLQIYDCMTPDELDRVLSEALSNTRMWPASVEPVVDCIIHAVTATYPERIYRPNWAFPLGLFATLPFWIAEPLFAKQPKRHK